MTDKPVIAVAVVKARVARVELTTLPTPVEQIDMTKSAVITRRNPLYKPRGFWRKAADLFLRFWRR